MKVLNYGSLNVDYVYTVDHIIVGGETEHSSKLEVFSGGKGLNQSIALAKAGVPVIMQVSLELMETFCWMHVKMPELIQNISAGFL